MIFQSETGHCRADHEEKNKKLADKLYRGPMLEEEKGERKSLKAHLAYAASERPNPGSVRVSTRGKNKAAINALRQTRKKKENKRKNQAHRRIPLNKPEKKDG